MVKIYQKKKQLILIIKNYFYFIQMPLLIFFNFLFIFSFIFINSILSDDWNCGKKVVGYFTSTSGRELNMEQGNSLTHLIYAENLQIDKQGDFFWSDPAHFNATLKAAKQFPALKFMVSIGGWDGDSKNLSIILNDEASRMELHKNIISLIKENNLDGIIFDWEYNAITYSIEGVKKDKIHFINLLNELRFAFNQLPNRPLLSILAAQSPYEFLFPNHTELNQILDIVDLFIIKAYDYYGNWNWQTGPPSPLFDALPKDRLESSEAKYADWTIRYYGCRTTKLEKLIFLFSLYGWYWKSSSFTRVIENENAEDGIWRNAKAPFTGGVIRWRKIDTMFNRNMTIYNRKAETPYIYDELNKTFLGFENEQSIEAKINYIFKYGIGGISLYAIDYDDDGNSLIHLVKSKMKSKCENTKIVEKYNCTQKQDDQCEMAKGICTMEHQCAGGNFARGKCKSSIASDVICCLGEIITEESEMSQRQKTIFGLFLALFLCAIILAAFFAFKKWQKKNAQNNASFSTTTTAVIKYDADSSDGLVIDQQQENMAFKMEISRNEQPSLDPVSSFNDLITPNELNNRWQFIQQNAATLVIKGKVFRGVSPGDMEKICELGRGNYGLVNKCRFRQNDLAIKQIRITSNHEVKRALMDLKILRICRSKFITTYYGYLIDENYLYICMESMATCLGKILDNDLERKRGLPEIMVGKVANSVVRALEYLRVKHNLMHRDVKPSNILLGQDGIKLCDFGISGRLKESKSMLTKNIGALAYLAPERTHTDKVYDIKADVWSVGISLLELATGVHPFEAPSELELIAKIQKATPEGILTASTKNSTNLLTNELTGFIKNCLHREFNRRADYRQLLNTPFLRLYERIPVDVWLWYKRMKENQLKNAILEIC